LTFYRLLWCSNPEFRLVAPGCLSHPDDTVASSLLNVLAMLKQKVCRTCLSFWLLCAWLRSVSNSFLHQPTVASAWGFWVSLHGFGNLMKQ